MAGYRDLSEFELSVIVGARGMGHSFSEVAMRWRFSRTTIPRMHCEYRESGKTSNLQHRCDRENILLERDQRGLKRIVQRDRSATLP